MPVAAVIDGGKFERQLGVENRQFRKQRRADDHGFEQGLGVGEHGGGGAFAASAGGGRDREDRQGWVQQFVVALVVEDVAGVGGHGRHALGGVDAAAATDTDHRVTVVVFQEGHGSFQHVGGGVRFDAGKHFIADVTLGQRGEKTFHHARRHQPCVSDHQQFFPNMGLEQCTGLTHQTVAAFQSGGEIKLERVHGVLRFLLVRRQ